MSERQPIPRQQPKQPTRKPVHPEEESLISKSADHRSQNPLITPRNIHHLQRTIGNKATIRLLGNTPRRPVIEGRVKNVVQRVHYLTLRKLHSHYKGETKKQRPGLIAAIRYHAGKIKDLWDARVLAEQVFNANMTPYNSDLLNDAHLRWRKRIEFLRKQDVSEAAVSDRGVFTAKELRKRKVKYDTSEDQQAATKIAVNGNTLNRSGIPLTAVDTANSVTFQRGLGWEIFVMSPTGDIHMTSHKIGLRHHSSLLAGGNISAAGMMKVNGGAIQELAPHSGHYRPQESHMRQVIHQLHKKGNNLNFDLDNSTDTFGNSSVFGNTIRADDYWTSIAGGGHGGGETFEQEKTWVAWSDCVKRLSNWFLRRKGEDVITEKLLTEGWQIIANPTATTAGSFIKPDTNPATQKEIRAFLNQHFPRTKSGWEKFTDKFRSARNRISKFRPRFIRHT
jgi:hypothetical protein